MPAILLPLLLLAADPVFPPLKATDLNRREVAMPGGFEGELNLLLIAFQREQQKDIDTWLEVLPPVAKEHPAFRYYELPTISRAWRPTRFFIDNGMRGGIPDPAQRARTITLYIDKEPFKKSLGLGAESTIYAVLVDRAGRVRWKAEGRCNAASRAALEAQLKDK